MSGVPGEREPSGACPCGSPRTYEECCGVYHEGKPAPDAESLMRSRYSAYARGLAKYLILTWHPRTRPAALDLSRDAMTWTGLLVLRAEKRGKDRAIVHFVAHYIDANGDAGSLEEQSRFVRERARWFYVDGDVKAE